jgi:hypothetical protein
MEAPHNCITCWTSRGRRWYSWVRSLQDTLQSIAQCAQTTDDGVRALGVELDQLNHNKKRETMVERVPGEIAVSIGQLRNHRLGHLDIIEPS